MRALLLIALTAMLAASLYYAYGLWVAVEADMPAGLWVAMILGVLFSIVIGAGLMGLVFYSSRRGYDDRSSGRDQLR
jgi:fluoride ion exporter CrcB/FEX